MFSLPAQVRASIGSLNSVTITLAWERSSPVAASTSLRSSTASAFSRTFTTRGATSAGTIELHVDEEPPPHDLVAVAGELAHAELETVGEEAVDHHLHGILEVRARGDGLVEGRHVVEAQHLDVEVVAFVGQADHGAAILGAGDVGSCRWPG